MTRLSVVVVTYSRADLLERCLDSLRPSLQRVPAPVEVVVVDDGAQPALPELVGERFREASVVATRNVGFAGAAAAGIRATSGEWIALLNDDVTVEPQSLAELIAAGDRTADVGAVAAQIRFAGRDTINSAGLEVDRLGVARDRLLGAPLAASEEEPVEVFGASGGAALYRRAMLEDVGSFDESFFAYLEDADLAWRARMRGWRCLYAPAAVVHHHHSSSFGHRTPRKHFLVGRNRVRLVAKNAAARQLVRYGLAMAAYDLAYSLYVGLRQGTLAPVRGRARGLADWRTYRRAGRAGRRPLELPRGGGIRAALLRDRAWPGGGSGCR